MNKTNLSHMASGFIGGLGAAVGIFLINKISMYFRDRSHGAKAEKNTHKKYKNKKTTCKYNRNNHIQAKWIRPAIRKNTIILSISPPILSQTLSTTPVLPQKTRPVNELIQTTNQLNIDSDVSQENPAVATVNYARLLSDIPEEKDLEASVGLTVASDTATTAEFLTLPQVDVDCTDRKNHADHPVMIIANSQYN